MSKCIVLLLGVLLRLPGNVTGENQSHYENISSHTDDPTCGIWTAGLTDGVWEAHVRVPWTATLYLRTESQPDKLFSAVILSAKLILMNANKLFADGDKKLHLFPFSNYEARTNTTMFSDAITPFLQVSQITHIRIHPTYSGLSQRDAWQISHNNFAIVHLKEPLLFDSQVHPPCVPSVNQMKRILTSWTNSTNSVMLHGWKRHVSESLVLRMAPNNRTTCEDFWYGHEETGHANYRDRICANVSSLNSHTLCIHSGVGVFTKLDTRFYFTGLVNNLYSDNRQCTSRARYFISHNTPEVLKWIQQNKKCGPNKFTCNNGDCIPLEGSLCNRTAECSDLSDEDPIYFRGLNYCNVKEFGCGVYGKCINQNQTCDGKINCEEGEDEMDCPSSGSPLLSVLLSISAVAVLIVTIIAFMLWRRMKLAQEKLRYLTDEEVAEFEHGSVFGVTNLSQQLEDSKHFYATSPSTVLQVQPEKFAWNGLQFEIPKNNLIIDWGKSLGSGISGVVYRGSLQDHKGNGNLNFPVAVKTFKSTADVESFKALLSELKIMTRVGNHDNIVTLVGAYTREIKQRILYIAVELCGMGDLERFLKTNRTAFTSATRTEHTERNRIYEQTRWRNAYANKDVLNDKILEFRMSDLLKWSYQIANGMEHLASLNITHGDLATRNVLITEDFSAKISDFGLARNLYESGIYVKKQAAPLPWRWMAVESLRDFEFSTNSDIWAYGVTLWEIYSLGGVPFPGLGWTADFVEKLYEGLRMSKPSYASTELYNKMLDCWENVPTHRPSFSALKHFFKTHLQEISQDEATKL